MFTGIIEEIGIVESVDKSGPIASLEIAASEVSHGLVNGQSITVNGVCLTLVKVDGNCLKFEIMPETFSRSNLGLLKPSDKVNLERALKVDGRIDGHFVTGHIDATGVITKKAKKGGDVIIQVRAPDEVMRYIVLKGSVALDGVSLTVSAVGSDDFSVSLIPYTRKGTTLGLEKEKQLVNIECDILGKYIHKFTHFSPKNHSNINYSFLQEHGFAS